MKKNKASLWIALIIFIAIFLRFYDLKTVPPGLWSDEAMNGVNAIQALEGGQWKVFYPENFGREGLFINIQALFVKFFGHEPWVLRLPSAIFGVLTVLGLYLMAKELFRLSANSESSSNKRIALFASFFLATSFWHIIFSRMGFRAIMAPLFLVWSFYFLFKLLRVANEKSECIPNRARASEPPERGLSASDLESASKIRYELLAAIAGLLLGLGFHTYIAFRIAPLLALYPLWIFYKTSSLEAKLPSGSRAFKNHCAPCLIVLFIFMTIVAASPLLIYYTQNPADFFGRTSSISIFSSPQPLGQFSENVLKTAQMFNFFGDFNWRHNYAGSPQLWWPVGMLFLLGIYKSIKKAINPKPQAPNPKQYQNPNDQNQKRFGILNFGNWNLFGISDLEFGASENLFPFKFILLWFSVMMLPVVMSSEGLPHALRSIVLIPSAMIFAAIGLEFLIQKFNFWIEINTKTYPEKRFQLNRVKNELLVLLIIFFIAAASNAFSQYFFRWAPRPEVYDSFQGNITKIAHWLNNEPLSIKKYVVTNSADTVDLTGRPTSFAPIIFITDTYFENKQKEKNIYYLGNAEFDKIDCSSACEIVPVESQPTIYETLKEKIPSLRIDGSPGFVVLKN